MSSLRLAMKKRTSLVSAKQRFEGAEEEANLIYKITLGDQNALEILYDLYCRVVFSLVLRILRRKEDAEEITQNVFLQVWEKAKLFNFEKGTVYTWLINMARNKAIDKLRSKEYRQVNENTFELDKYDWWLEDRKDFAIDTISDIDTAEHVKNALSSLPAGQRLVIEMVYFEGCTQNEIAETLCLPLGTVKTRARQAMIKLQKYFSGYN